MTNPKNYTYTDIRVKVSNKHLRKKKMGNQKILIAGISAVILVLAALTFFISSGKKIDIGQKQTLAPTVTPTPTPIPGETVMVTVHGFVPEKLTVKKGTYINFVNLSDTESVDVESDDHPTHKKFPQLNIGPIKNGFTSALVKYDTPGTYTYHNHLNPNMKGTIIIKD